MSYNIPFHNSFLNGSVVLLVFAVSIIIETSETKDTTDPLIKKLWKGMLYDIPKNLQNREVIQEGYGIVAQCNILTILEDGEKNE